MNLVVHDLLIKITVGYESYMYPVFLYMINNTNWLPW